MLYSSLPPSLHTHRSLMSAGRMWGVWLKPSRRCWMLFSCPCSIQSSSLAASGGLECCSMGHQERGRPYSLRLSPQNAPFTSSGMEA